MYTYGKYQFFIIICKTHFKRLSQLLTIISLDYLNEKYFENFIIDIDIFILNVVT